ncbi:alanine--tRNA ligase [Victivallaceae bacterium BBE-744-WT-12]|uniref:Alanine--tRNA ligase n=1 Tax=Victivallis lenta TaxID=2606640 RepID=A0A844G5J2_9BACT|nr:alanine--tRNA ligase [Victivallis lenta]AVM44437.1 alanine--tRNA ligase [Victivallales bacterium CCUG 44730]MBS5532315.1 alanine--tRNA ligase [bacterium]HBP05290.1 alanine--tRNA ligase [Lentisphaeria bacterium]MST99067.1 alanine--tRNA ligase [Victivallis lenta]HCH86390.1 alanine--tRNA ligase [Lentisphaeria bacterium]
MKASEIRRRYIEFFKNRNHAEIKSAPLIPENDPTCLFTTAGMHPLVPYLLGAKHPSGTRLTDYQKCIRTGDIDEVGDPVHLTFFEMLGNWSLGDYFKKEMIGFSFEFLTGKENLNIPADMLAVTVFAGDEDCPFDEEAYNEWRSHGIPAARIAKLGKKDNWWGPAGTTGPCGPDTEMFYWTGPLPAPETFDPGDKRWVEIWNDVFMQYNKTADGKFEPLAQKNVDTGMGLERVTAILQGKASCYETEIFAPIFAKLDEIRGIDAPAAVRTSSERIIADHLRAATFILGDGITPGKVDQPYVLRRLIRRAIREGRKLGINDAFTSKIADAVIEEFGDVYPELRDRAAVIREELDREEKQFAVTLEKGTHEFQKLIDRVPAHIEKKIISGKNAFNLYETYGFPIELTIEMAQEKGFQVDRAGYDAAFAKHQEMSRAGAEQKFKGGLADSSEATAALHSATHLLQAALRKVLGTHVEQRGSNITAERLRFDFSHEDKMTPEQLKQVEDLVNDAISRDLPIVCEEMDVETAKNSGAMGLFENKYDAKVKVYTMGDVSKEICGGPHASRTGELGRFKIKKEESSSRGVRRIKAVLER